MTETQLPRPPTKPLLTIGGVKIHASADGCYIWFKSDLDVCNDGTGPAHGDPSYQPMTAYNPYLNADKDKYIVIPPQVRKMVEPKVMGCMAALTNLTTDYCHAAVCGEIGPDYTTGEASYVLAKLVNHAITHNSGDKSKHYLYELWPGIPAVVNGKHYKLQ